MTIDAATYARLRALAGSEKRRRLDIVKDLIRFDLLRCRPISTVRHTAHLTAVLHREDSERTITMETEIANQRPV